MQRRKYNVIISQHNTILRNANTPQNHFGCSSSSFSSLCVSAWESFCEILYFFIPFDCNCSVLPFGLLLYLDSFSFIEIIQTSFISFSIVFRRTINRFKSVFFQCNMFNELCMRKQKRIRMKFRRKMNRIKWKCQGICTRCSLIAFECLFGLFHRLSCQWA